MLAVAASPDDSFVAGLATPASLDASESSSVKGTMMSAGLERERERERERGGGGGKRSGNHEQATNHNNNKVTSAARAHSKQHSTQQRNTTRVSHVSLLSLSSDELSLPSLIVTTDATPGASGDFVAPPAPSPNPKLLSTDSAADPTDQLRCFWMLDGTGGEGKAMDLLLSGGAVDVSARGK